MIKFLFLLIIISNFEFSQQKTNGQSLWHLTVVDSVSAKGIERVTVSINKKRYYINGNNGIIDINKAFVHLKDSISFSCVGYKSVVLIPDINYIFPDTVRLTGSVTDLQEVKVSTAKPMETIIGDARKSYNAHRKTSPNRAYAQYIPNAKKIKGTITYVEYVINDVLQGIELPFRVRLYTKSKNSLVLDEELIKDSIIVYNPDKKRRLSVDISRYNVQLPDDGIIVIFETLSPSYYNNGTVWYKGFEYLKMPGIDMDLKKKDDYSWDINDRRDRNEPYCMVGPVAERRNLEGTDDGWNVYNQGINFAITLTISE